MKNYAIYLFFIFIVCSGFGGKSEPVEPPSSSTSESIDTLTITDETNIDDTVVETIEIVPVVEEPKSIVTIRDIIILEYNYNGIVLQINNIFNNNFQNPLNLQYIDMLFLNRANVEISDYHREARTSVPSGASEVYTHKMKVLYQEFVDAGIEINTNISVFSLSGNYLFDVAGKKEEVSLYYPFRLQIPPIPKPTLTLNTLTYNKALDTINIVFEVKMYKPNGFTHFLVSSDNRLAINGEYVDKSIANVSDIAISQYGVISFFVTYNINKNNFNPNIFLLLKDDYDINYSFNSTLLFKDPNDYDHTINLVTKGTIQPS